MSPGVPTQLVSLSCRSDCEKPMPGYCKRGGTLGGYPLGGIHGVTGLLRSGTWLNHPAPSPTQQMRAFHDVQELALAHQALEVVHAVAAELLVLEVNPKPNPQTSVVDVKRARFRV